MESHYSSLLDKDDGGHGGHDGHDHAGSCYNNNNNNNNSNNNNSQIKVYSLLLFSCLYPNKIQAYCPGHTFQLVVRC